ncbi:MAG TPA: TraV family lipoprotein [Pseudorhodoferax sp.]|nr:TraV family lipoprotein [Pseudorhodoferax sp.]
MRRWLALGTLPLAGCMNMSGLDGETRYACAAPNGVACDSVSSTYANALRHNLPSQRGHAAATGAASAGNVASAGPSVDGAAWDGESPLPRPTVMGVAPGGGDTVGAARDVKALRSPARILRLWTKPWEDADGDLWDQGYVYVQVDTGGWRLDHVHQRIRDQYLPLQPPPATPPTVTPPTTAVPHAEVGPLTEGLSQATPRNAATTPFASFPSFNRSPAPAGQRQP